LAATGLAHAGRVGLAGLAAVVALWVPAGGAPGRSDAHELGRGAAPMMRRGDLVVATAFAQIPLLAHELPPGLRYASTLGAVRDPHVVDWRDVTQRLGRASMRRDLLPLLANAPVGSRVLLVTPVAWDARSHTTLLGREERHRSREYTRELLHDGRFERIRTLPTPLPPLARSSLLRGVLLRKVS
jgi:mannosyltransferase